jgi:hypothetical protein
MTNKRHGPASWLRALAMAVVTFTGTSASVAAPAASVHIEALTWTELRDRIAGGATPC